MLNPDRYAGKRMFGRIVASRYGSATCPATPVTPSRIRSPASDCGELAKYLDLSVHGPIVQPAGGSLNVRPSVLTNMPAMAPPRPVVPPDAKRQALDEDDVEDAVLRRVLANPVRNERLDLGVE